MQFAWRLDEWVTGSRKPRRRRGYDWRKPDWWVAAVECLEDRVQPAVFVIDPTVMIDASAGTLEATQDPAVYSLRIEQTGALTISFSAADGSQFVGAAALLTSDSRLLVERAFRNDVSVDSATFSEQVNPGDYRLRLQSPLPDSSEFFIETQFVSASNPGSPITVGDNPQAVQVVDINRDTFPDLIVPNLDSNTISVLLGRGDGTFADRPTIDLEFGPMMVLVVDVVGDDNVDLVISLPDSYQVLVMLGGGDGTFAEHTTIDLEFAPTKVQVKDLNGDGKVDLVIPNSDSDEVRVFLSGEDETFVEQAPLKVGNNPQSVQVVDVNGDGHVDLVTPNSGSDNVSLLLGRGDGTFEKQRLFFVGDDPESIQGDAQSVEVVDVNGDDQVDLIAVNSNTNTLSVRLGHGDGSFLVRHLYAVGAFPTMVQVA